MVLYIVRNTANSKVYIGITTRGLETRWKEHVYNACSRNLPGKLYNALRRHGSAAFYASLLSQHNTWEELIAAEIEAIKTYDSYLNGYNCTVGGEGTIGNHLSEETKAHLHSVNTGKVLSPEHRQKISAANKGVTRNHTYGPRSAEHSLAISRGLTGKKHSVEHNRKIGEGNAGKTISPEQRAKISRTKRAKKTGIDSQN